MEYVHIHSDFSNGGLGFRDSTNSIKALVARHKELGCSAVMLTDHALCFWSCGIRNAVQ